MHPDIQSLLQLQRLDQRIAELQKEIAALPRHIAEIEKALESHNRKLEADRAALSANQKDRKKLEGDIQMQEQKISKLKSQMLEAKTNEQYRAFQHEIEFCENEIRKAEDKILDLMAESEPLEQNVKTAEAALKQERAQVEAEKVRAQERTAADRKELEESQARRTEILNSLSLPIQTAYARIRKKWNTHVVVADATEGRCSACNMALRPQFFQDLKMAETTMFCESCGRILYYNPPVSFEQDIDASAPVQNRPMPIRRI